MIELLKPKDVSEYNNMAKRFKIVHIPTESDRDRYAIKFQRRWLWGLIKTWSFVQLRWKRPMKFIPKVNNHEFIFSVLQSKSSCATAIKNHLERYYMPYQEEEITLEDLNNIFA